VSSVFHLLEGTNHDKVGEYIAFNSTVLIFQLSFMNNLWFTSSLIIVDAFVNFATLHEASKYHEFHTQETLSIP